MNPVIIGNATLYLGDCREILPTLPKVDAVITDFIGADYLEISRDSKGVGSTPAAPPTFCYDCPREWVPYKSNPETECWACEQLHGESPHTCIFPWEYGA